jgi:hypothetical protein
LTPFSKAQRQSAEALQKKIKILHPANLVAETHHQAKISKKATS